MKTQKETKKEINTVSEDTKQKTVEGEIADDTVKDAAGGFFRDPRSRFRSDPPKRTFIP